MKRPAFACIIAVGLWLGMATVSQGALYEFTLEGRVTYAAIADVPIDTPVTIRYTVDSEDLAPSPGGGLYAASQATVEFPTFTIRTDGMIEPTFRVSLGNGTSVQILQYLTWQNLTWGISIPFSFPPRDV